MSRLSPSLDDIRIHYKLFTDLRFELMTDAEQRAFLILLKMSAANRVWTFTEPGDGGVTTNDATLARVCALTPKRWLKVKAAVLNLFVVREGRLYPNGDWIEIQGSGDRPAIPASLRSEVMRRDRWTCVYCGKTEGPFDVDHVVPLSRGGSNTSADNLVCACARCNRSKGALTPSEWLGTAARSA